MAIHSMVINRIVTILGFLPLYVRWQKASALNIIGLATQAAVFILLAISWNFRVYFSDRFYGKPFDFERWYEIMGWAPIDNAIFAIVQFILFCLASRNLKGGSSQREKEPLPHH